MRPCIASDWITMYIKFAMETCLCSTVSRETALCELLAIAEPLVKMKYWVCLLVLASLSTW